MSINLLLLLIAAAGLYMLVWACFGTWVAGQKGRSQTEGTILGMTLGMFGILIEALLPAQHRYLEVTELDERPQRRREWSCTHIALVAKWDSVADMGHEDKASRYTCDACGQSFTAEEGRTLRETEAERVRQRAGTDTPPAT